MFPGDCHGRPVENLDVDRSDRNDAADVIVKQAAASVSFYGEDVYLFVVPKWELRVHKSPVNAILLHRKSDDSISLTCAP